MTRLKSVRFFLAVPVLLLGTSCFVSKAEGQLMTTDIDGLKKDVATLQRERSDSEIVQRRKQGEIDTRLLALENVVFKRAASEGSENDRIQKELEELRNQLEEMQKGMEAPKVVTPPAPADEKAPAGKKAHFDWAHEAFEDEKYDLAFARATSFADKYKDDKVFGAAIYMLKGDAAEALAKDATTDAAKMDYNKKALSAYQDLLTRFAKSPKVPEALFKVGETMRAMGFAKEAKVFFQEIVEKYPKSPFAKQAKAKLVQINQSKKK